MLALPLITACYRLYVPNQPLRAPIKVAQVEEDGSLLLEDGRRVRPRVPDDEPLRHAEAGHCHSHRLRACTPTIPPECADELSKQPGWPDERLQLHEAFAESWHRVAHRGRPCVAPIPIGCVRELWREWVTTCVAASGNEVDVQNEAPLSDGAVVADVHFKIDRRWLRSACGFGRPIGLSLRIFPERVPQFDRARLGAYP